MNKLDELRNEIDDIDSKMKELFIKRMEVVKEIKIYKKNNHLPIKNSKREKEIVNKLVDGVNSDIIILYEDFIKYTMKLSKRFQKDKNE